jgi:hypothetical protein
MSLERDGKGWRKQYHKREATLRTIERLHPGGVRREETSVLCLVGLATGGIGHIPYQALWRVLEGQAGLIHLMMPFAQPYSLAVFSGAEEARVAQVALDGVEGPGLGGRVVWAEYWHGPLPSAPGGVLPPGWDVVEGFTGGEEETELLKMLGSRDYAEEHGLDWAWGEVNGRGVVCCDCVP